MTAEALFWLTFGPYLAAALTALFADAFVAPGGRSATIAPAVLLAAGGLTGLVGGWTVESAEVMGVLLVGSAHSAVPGLIGVLAAASLIGMTTTLSHRRAQGSALVSFAAIGSGLAVATHDLLFLLIALETAAVAGYALVALSRDRRSSESAFKYFVLGAIATGFFVLGLSILAPMTGGSPQFSQIAVVLSALTRVTPGLVAVLFIMSALLLKTGAAPFHWWAPDVYETAPPFASAFLAGAVKLAIVSALGSFVLLSVPGAPSGVFGKGSGLVVIALILGVSAVASIVIGSLGALAQRSYARMLAYAGIAQAGYALVAISALNASAAVVLVATYAIAATATFLSVGAFAWADPEWDGTIDGLAGRGRTHPLLSGSVAVALVSLAGVPPLVGFWGKFQAFGAAVSAGVATAGEVSPVIGVLYGTLVTVAVVGSVVSVGYYGSVIRSLYFTTGDSAESEKTQDASPRNHAAWVIAVLAAACLALGVAPFVLGLPRMLAGLMLTM